MIARLRALSLPARALIAGVLLTAFFVLGAAQQVWLRTAGDEVILDVAPVDPRDIFFGHYVILAYQAERLDSGEVAIPQGLEPGAAWLTLREDADGIWVPDSLLKDRPDGAVALRGVLNSPAGPDEDGPIFIELPLPDRYYASAGTARALEDSRNDGALQVILSVRGGAAAIKGLVVDGEAQYDRLF